MTHDAAKPRDPRCRWPQAGTAGTAVSGRCGAHRNHAAQLSGAQQLRDRENGHTPVVQNVTDPGVQPTAVGHDGCSNLSG